MKKIILLAMIAIVIVSCSKNQDSGPEIALIGGNDIQSVYADQITLPHSISFTTTAGWSSTITEDATTKVAPEWISINPWRASEAGDYTINVNLEKNFSGFTRAATIKISCNNDYILLRVIQNGQTETGVVPIESVQSVAIGLHDLNLEKGETATLVATITPQTATNKEVTWTSFDPNVVTVDEAGVVRAINPGSTIVTVVTQDGAKYDQCNVTVPNRPVVGATMNKTTLTFEKFETTPLFVNFLPNNATNQKLTWRNVNPDVASFDDNDSAIKQLVAKQTGTTTITAVTDEGAIEAQCLVTVVDNTSNGSGTITLGFSEDSDQVFNLRYAHYTVVYNAIEECYQYLLYIETSEAPNAATGNRPSITIPFYASSQSSALAAGTYTFGSDAMKFQKFDVSNLGLKMEYLDGTIDVAVVGDQYTITFNLLGSYPNSNTTGELTGSYTGKIKNLNGAEIF